MIEDRALLEEEFARARPDRRSAGRILRYLAAERGRVAAALALEVGWVASMILGPHLVQVAIDGPIRERAGPALAWVAVLYAANTLARTGGVVLQIRLAARAGYGVLAEVRKDLFAHVQRLSLDWFDRTREGKVLARIDRDVEALEGVVVWGPIELASACLSLVLVLVQMTLYDGRLACALLAFVPVLLAGGEFLRRRGFAAHRRVRERASRIHAHLAETLSGLFIVQAFVRERENLGELAGIHASHDSEIRRGAWVWSAYVPFVGLVYAAAALLVLGYGGSLVRAGEMELGEVAAFLLLLGMLFGPIEELAGLYDETLAAASAAERIFQVLDTSPAIADGPGGVVLSRVEGRIEFDRVTFSYPGQAGEPALVEASFVALPGRTLALVGRTGSGKTTVVGLLARFYEPDSGTIRIDGEPLARISVSSLRHAIALVPQEGFLFSGTLLENLRYGRPDASPEEVERAARELGVHEVFATLPRGYLTHVRERGEGLSSGQRQLAALTRALVADPRILILDEATSAVDPGMERTIQEAILALRQGRTTVVVAHRLSTVVGADEILVLSRGRIVERGDHGALLAAGKVYRDLYDRFARE
ncbi:MAG: ABC transporter ATP-binding protein [Planctomycetes bacterium]|nr:ABC transporter ATP-binding protein [Planctomycetota bacterium]